MADEGETIDWRQLREFADIELARSYVLAWQLERGALLVDVDLELGKSHVFYEEPRPAERVCIRPATIEFPTLKALELNGAGGDGIEETVSRLQLGAIHGFRRSHDGPYQLDGEFGTVTIDAERPIVRFRRTA